MPKQTNYPEKLYRFRDGIVTYRHIEGNIYEDTSCRDHENCRICVRRVGDHFEFDSCANETAQRYVYFHKRVDLDSDYYPSRSGALRQWYENRIKRHYTMIDEAKEAVAIKEKLIAGMSLTEERPQCIGEADFGQVLILAYMDPNGKVGNIVAEETVEKKILSRSGLAALVTSGGRTVRDTDHQRFMAVTLDAAKFADENDTGGAAFLCRQDYDTFINNQEYEYLEQSINAAPRHLERINQDIEKLQKEMEDRCNNKTE